MPTFVEKYLNGEINNIEIEFNKYIDKWNSDFYCEKIFHDYLGLTIKEYEFYLKYNNLEILLKSHKFQQFILNRIKNMFEIPHMFGTSNEAFELQIITLLETWVFDIKNLFDEETTFRDNDRFVISLYISETKKKFPEIGNVYLSSSIKYRDNFQDALKGICGTMIERIKELRK